MRFNCKSPDQKEQERLERIWALQRKLLNWHTMFAWRRVHLRSGGCAWLEFVQRRFEFYDVPCNNFWYPEYEAIEVDTGDEWVEYK